MPEEITSQTAAQAIVDTAEQSILICDITSLTVAQALPEVGEDAELEPVEFAHGAIEQFVHAEDGNRTMRIVGFAGGLAAQVVQPAVVIADEQTE